MKLLRISRNNALLTHQRGSYAVIALRRQFLTRRKHDTRALVSGLQSVERPFKDGTETSSEQFEKS